MGLNCPVVLVLRPAEKNAAATSLLYRVYYEGDVSKPLVACEE